MTVWQRYELTESAATTLLLSPEQAAALRAVGRRLVDPNPSGDDSDRSAIECSSVDGVNWRVRVVNAVGVIGLPGSLRITVRPKIPTDHMMYLLRRGGAVPRTTPVDAMVSKSSDFQDLIASWFLGALETLIRGGLRRAYVEHHEKLPVVRGRVDVARTTIDLARGTLLVSGEFEELTEDTALNRILAAAAKRIARSPLMPAPLRRRARSAGYLLAGLSPLRPSDLRATPDRIAARYVDAIRLAKLVLSGAGVGLDNGDHRGASFLLPTPLIVEAALRQLAAEALHPHVEVAKGRLPIGNTQMTVNPDLVFGDLAVGDIKYKVWDGSWIRNDLYQLIAFAVAYERTAALHVGFGGPISKKPLQVGNTRLWRVTWSLDAALAPEEAAAAFQAHVREWWDQVRADLRERGPEAPLEPAQGEARLRAAPVADISFGHIRWGLSLPDHGGVPSAPAPR